MSFTLCLLLCYHLHAIVACTVPAWTHSNQTNQDPEDNLSSAAYVASLWGIEDELWDREWSNLSGGEAQRMSLAIALGISGTEVLLVDGTFLAMLLSRWTLSN